jgi:hypothetical protein
VIAVDAVLSYHLNPLTCGVAKFNLALGRRLDVPVVGVLDPEALRSRRPLVSLKLSEFRAEDARRLDAMLATAPWRQSFTLFLHDWTDSPVERALARDAGTVYCGNTEMTAAVAALRPDAVAVWCPSTIAESPRFEPVELPVFSFGMAHKVRTLLYERLRVLLDATGRSYCLHLSAALHADTTLDAFATALDELRGIFGPRLYFLGHLSDAAVYNHLRSTTFFAAFFDRGVRANNTTVNAAMSCGAVVVTNLDGHSPAAFRHGVNVLDIARCDALPTDAATLGAIGRRAATTATTDIGWDALIAAMSRHDAPLAAVPVRGTDGR